MRLALDHLPEPFRRAVFLAAITGQRRGDLVAMRWADYDGAALRFHQQKTGRKMTLPSPPARPATSSTAGENRRRPTPSSPTTPAPLGCPTPHERLGRLLVKIEGMRPHLGLHGIRKFRATELASAGASVHQIAAVTGHKTLAMVAPTPPRPTRNASREKSENSLSPVVRLSRKPLKKRGKVRAIYVMKSAALANQNFPDNRGSRQAGFRAASDNQGLLPWRYRLNKFAWRRGW